MIIGSVDSKWTLETKKALIEIGNFNYVNIFNTTNRWNIIIYASKRSFKSLSNYLQLVILNLIEKWFGKSSNIKFYMNYNHDKQLNYHIVI